MKCSLLIFLLTFFSFVHTAAQYTGTTIEFRKSFWSTGFYQQNEKLSNTRLKEIMSANPAALAELKKARTNQAFSGIFSGVGGFLIGWPIGTAAGGGDPKWAMAGIGAGLIVAAIPFEIAFTKKARSAVKMYNNGSGKSAVLQPHWRAGFTANGMGLRLSF